MEEDEENGVIESFNDMTIISFYCLAAQKIVPLCNIRETAILFYIEKLSEIKFNCRSSHISGTKTNFRAEQDFHSYHITSNNSVYIIIKWGLKATAVKRCI